MRIIFIGVQGSGKGTQAKLVSEKLKVPDISMGDLFRNACGESKKEIDSYVHSGNLATIGITEKLLTKRLQKPDCIDGFILDGFPRNKEQLKILNKIGDIDKVVEIKISDKEAVNRISGRVQCENCKAGYNIYTSPKPKINIICDLCGGKLVRRDDDYPEAVKKRIEIYHKETKPILKFFKGKLIEINGERSIEEINKDILKNLV